MQQDSSPTTTAPTSSDVLPCNKMQPFDPLGPFLVIGATGFLGAELTKQLCNFSPDWLPRGPDFEKQFPKVVVIARSKTINPVLEGLPITVHVAPEITEEVLLEVKEKVCGGKLVGVFHVAGMVKHTTEEKDLRQMREANVELTRTVLEFTSIHGIRTVYASSSGVVGCQTLSEWNHVAHDDANIASSAIRGLPYYQQKAEVERYWREKAAHGAPIVFLRPSLLLGPGDERLSSTRVVLQLIRNELPFLVPGGVSWVDVRDCAYCFVEAMMRSKTVTHGTVMNITAENTTFKDFCKTIAVHTGCTPPSMSLPPSLAVLGAKILTKMNKLLGLPRDEGVDPVFAECGNRFWNVSCQRAQDLLDFEPREESRTIIDTAKYLNRVFPVDEALVAAKNSKLFWMRMVVMVFVVILLIWALFFYKQ